MLKLYKYLFYKDYLKKLNELIIIKNVLSYEILNEIFTNIINIYYKTDVYTTTNFFDNILKIDYTNNEKKTIEIINKMDINKIDINKNFINNFINILKQISELIYTKKEILTYNKRIQEYEQGKKRNYNDFCLMMNLSLLY